MSDSVCCVCVCILYGLAGTFAPKLRCRHRYSIYTLGIIASNVDRQVAM